MPEASKHKTKRTRSPGYPSVNLQVAIKYARDIYEKEKRSPAPISVVAKHCGSNAKSSKGLRLIAALKQFGLVSESGEGESRQVRISERGLDIIVVGEETPKGREAVKEAALSPKIHKQLWDHYDSQLPSDENLRAYLIRTVEFHDDKVRHFIKEFKSTLAFAGLLEDGTMEDSNEDSGIDPFPATFANASNMDRPPMTTATISATVPPTAAGSKQDVFTLKEGPIILQWPDNLSSDSFEDLSGWWDIMLRKIKRSVVKESPTNE